MRYNDPLKPRGQEFGFTHADAALAEAQDDMDAQLAKAAAEKERLEEARKAPPASMLELQIAMQAIVDAYNELLATKPEAEQKLAGKLGLNPLHWIEINEKTGYWVKPHFNIPHGRALIFYDEFSTRPYFRVDMGGHYDTYNRKWRSDDRKFYQRKGKFQITEIAETLYFAMLHAGQQEDNQRKREAARGWVDTVKKALGLKYDGERGLTVEATADLGKPIRLLTKIEFKGTSREVVEVYQKLVDAGLVKPAEGERQDRGRPGSIDHMPDDRSA